MLELFNNPGYLAAGTALVSAPVVIHLINRMRFRRLRWAAMEFLLKAQKRNRRRLIIEQLLLLALRCLLIMLAALLVLRFVGFSLAGYSSKDGLHIVVLDDTLSMTDQWKEGGTDRNCFKVAKEDIVYTNILKKVAQSSTNERLVIVPLSELVRNPDFEPVVFQKLAELATEKEVKEYLEKLQPSKLHVDLSVGLEKATALIEAHKEKRPVVHIVSDFRQSDWSGPAAEDLKKALAKVAAVSKDVTDEKAELRLWDTSNPSRLEEQGGPPLTHDNVAIVDFKANSRLVGKRMPVTFSVTVANNSPNDKNVNVVIYRFESGPGAGGKESFTVKEQLDLTFVPAMPFKVPANGTAVATFKYTPQNVKEGNEFNAERFCVHLETPQRSPLEDDGLPGDNIRYASVQIRNKIPILLIDGDGKDSDSTTYVETAIKSISDSFDIRHGTDINVSDPTQVLKTGNLMDYAAIYLLNVPKLTEPGKDNKEDDQKLKNLENYVRDGGSVMFFLGPQVSGKYYTDTLYRKGQGIFPAPISEAIAHDADVDPNSKNVKTIGSQLKLREDRTELKDLPIFGKMILQKKQALRLELMNVIKHFSVPRNEWIQPKGQIFELATLPNKKSSVEAGLDTTGRDVLKKLEDILQAEKYEPYRSKLKKAMTDVSSIMFSAPAYRVGLLFDRMLTEGGDDKKTDANSPAQFWALNDPKIVELRKEIKEVVEQAVYGDPLVVSRHFGKGRVVAVMTTAGAGWNDWGSGFARDLWPLFQKYSLNYMFDQSVESSLLVGQTPPPVTVNKQKYPHAKQLKVVRTFYEARVGQPVKLREETELGTIKDGVQTFPFGRADQDGFYVSQLFSDADEKKPLETWENVFNVDTKNESKLQRVSAEDAKSLVLYENYPDVKIHGFGVVDGNILVNKQNDLSDTPWFFLFFIIVLVTEQALAVHLSYHMRGAENQVPAQAMTSQLRAA